MSRSKPTTSRWLPPGQTHAKASQRKRTRHHGMSLLEVMLATVMLLAAVMALSRVAFLARRHALKAEDRSQAQLLCQNIVQELLAGARPLRNVSPEAFEGDQWVYTVDVDSVEGTALSKVTVRVDRMPDETGRLPTAEEIDGYQLVHWLRTGKPRTTNPDESNP